MNPNDIPTPGGNFNDQSTPGAGQVATEPTSFFQTLQQDYLSSDGVSIRPSSRVRHPVRGLGTAVSLLGGSLLMSQKVLVQFDSGEKLATLSSDLFILT